MITLKNNYAKGAAKERKIIHCLIDKHKCTYAARIAGSHSAFDVIGVSDALTYLVQSKSTKSTPKGVVSLLIAYKNDLSKMNLVNSNVRSVKELWIFVDCKRLPIKILLLNDEHYKKKN